MLLEMVYLLLLTFVGPETVLEPASLSLYEYTPTATDIPPPYALAPLEEEEESDEPDEDVNDDAVQLVNVLLEMVLLLLLTVVGPEPVLEPPPLYE